MSRSAAGLTLFFIFIVRAASSEEVNPADSCDRCRRLATSSEKFPRENIFSKEENDLRQYCFQACRHLLSEGTVKNFSAEHVMSADPNRSNPLKKEEQGLRSLGLMKFILELLKYYIYQLFVFFRAIISCAFRNTITVLEATLELQSGSFRTTRCERLDLVNLGVPPFYIKLMQSIARFLMPKLRSDPLLTGLVRELPENPAISPRLQRSAIQKMFKSN